MMGLGQAQDSLQKRGESFILELMSEIQWADILPSYDQMMAVGMHYGRKKTVFHPKMGPFVYTMKETIHIIDLLKTEEKLKETVEYLKKVKDSGGIILWVASTKQSEQKIVEIAQQFKMPYIANRWLGGTLTNFKTIRGRIDYFQSIEAKLANEVERAKMIKKERVKLEKDYNDMKQKFDGLRSLTKIPDVVFVTSLKEGGLAVKEAKRVGATAVAIVNTESNPALVDYPIPANDNARGSVELILETIRKGLI